MDNFKFLQDLNYLDIGFVLLLLSLTWKGISKGFFAELCAFAGLVLAFICSGKFYSQISPYLKNFIAAGDTRDIVAYILTFAGIMILVDLAGRLLKVSASITLSSWPNHILGGMVGFAKGLISCAILITLVKRFAPGSKILAQSALAKPMGDIAQWLYSFLPNVTITY